MADQKIAARSRLAGARRATGVGTPGTTVRNNVSRAITVLLRLLVVVLFLAVWQLASGVLIDPFWVSRPTDILAALITKITSATLWINVGYTICAALVGGGIGTVAGVLTGFVLGVIGPLDRVFTPFLALLNTLPRFALAPLFIVWFGLGVSSKIWLVVSIVFFIVAINVHKGVKSVDPDLIALMRVLRASRTQQYVRLYMPSVVPWLFAALQLSMGYALGTAIIGEMLGGRYGLGVEISRASALFDLAGVFAAILVLLGVAVLLQSLITIAERKALRWRQPNN